MHDKMTDDEVVSVSKEILRFADRWVADRPEDDARANAATMAQVAIEKFAEDHGFGEALGLLSQLSKALIKTGVRANVPEAVEIDRSIKAEMRRRKAAGIQ